MTDFDLIHALNEEQMVSLHELFKSEWWSSSRTLQEVQTLLAHSFSFGFVDKQTGKLIAFGRVITDFSQFALICDVIVAKYFRNKSFGMRLMKEITSHHKLAHISKFELRCLPTLIPFYTRCGFIEHDPEVVTMIRTSSSF